VRLNDHWFGAVGFRSGFPRVERVCRWQRIVVKGLRVLWLILSALPVRRHELERSTTGSVAGGRTSAGRAFVRRNSASWQTIGLQVVARVQYDVRRYPGFPRVCAARMSRPMALIADSPSGVSEGVSRRQVPIGAATVVCRAPFQQLPGVSSSSVRRGSCNDPEPHT